MLKTLWQKWTIDKLAAFGDRLWDVFVVQVAAFLDRLTWRQVVAYIPLVILLLAYSNGIPVSPALIFVGDLLAYIDLFAVFFLVGLFSRAETILYVIKQAAARVGALASSLMTKARLGVRYRRERGPKGRTRLTGRPRNDDGEPAAVAGLA